MVLVRRGFYEKLANSEALIVRRELYLWAASVLTSRSFPGPAVFNQVEGHFPAYNDNAEGRAPVLIPGLDLLNHNPASQVAWIWDSVTCTIKTEEFLSERSEVSNNYGPKSNEERKLSTNVQMVVRSGKLIRNS